MELWSLEQQPVLVQQLRTAASRGALSHALLFTGPGERLAAARFAAAAMECAAEEGKPCGHCGPCRKVLQDIHPDVITVRDEEHKNVAMDVVRQIRADAYIRPNEGARKVYLFPDCGLLTEGDQNLLLKLVEEGPAYAAFCFCAENPAAVLQTLRSRCVEMRLRPAQEQTEDEAMAQELCRSLGRRGGAVEFAAALERKRITREGIAQLLEQSRQILAADLLERCSGRKMHAPQNAGVVPKTLTNVQIMRTIELLQKYKAECRYNVGPYHVLGALAAELEDIP